MYRWLPHGCRWQCSQAIQAWSQLFTSVRWLEGMFDTWFLPVRMVQFHSGATIASVLGNTHSCEYLMFLLSALRRKIHSHFRFTVTALLEWNLPVTMSWLHGAVFALTHWAPNQQNTYRTWRFITSTTKGCNWSLLRASSFHFTSHLICLSFF